MMSFPIIQLKIEQINFYSSTQSVYVREQGSPDFRPDAAFSNGQFISTLTTFGREPNNVQWKYIALKMAQH